ncbi:MAG: hypothetical protein KF785_10680 [Gemmatimonadales bacterium]|nr:hypothetical protein [Gemmatimonadales bacterium]
MKLLTLLLTLTLALSGCLGTDSQEVALGQEFELAPNQSVRVAGTPLIIGFRRVVADSRCPIDALCVTEGQAGIELEIFGGGPAEPILVNNPLPTAWAEDGYRIRLLDLLPLRTVAGSIGPDQYRLRLAVDLTDR